MRAHTIYSVGDPPGGMYGLVRGTFALSIAPGERGPYVAHFVRPGTWFGEAGRRFTEQPRRVSLAVTRDSKLLHLPLHAIREIVAVDPGAWRFFGLVAAPRPLRRRHWRSGRSFDPRSRQAQHRRAAAPRRMPVSHAARFADRSKSTSARKTSPSMTNVARTTAGTVLRTLEAAGHVKVSYRRAAILAPDKLRAMLDE